MSHEQSLWVYTADGIELQSLYQGVPAQIPVQSLTETSESQLLSTAFVGRDYHSQFAGGETEEERGSGACLRSLG